MPGHARWLGQSRLAINTKTRSATHKGSPGPPEVIVEDLPQAELLEQGADHEHRPPGPGLRDESPPRRIEGGVAAEDAFKFGQQRVEDILAAKVGDDALLDLAVVAVGFDNADVLVDRAVGGGDFDGAGMNMVGCWRQWSKRCRGTHSDHYHDDYRANQGERSGIVRGDPI